MKPEQNWSSLPPSKLVTPRRLDLAVKHRLFCHYLYGGDPAAIDLYNWHIQQRSGARISAGIATDRWKLALADYRQSALDLVASMGRWGFLAEFPVPVDPAGELLDGSHRVACAMAMKLPTVHVIRRPEAAWAPPWDRLWFEDHGLPPAEIDALTARHAEMQNANND